MTRSQRAMSTPSGLVDHEPQALGGRPLEREQLDFRLLIAKP